ncbi:MAG: 50S ribosomal protein L23 [Opitutales bacterium]|nr:50S ribosomal protein L23 [Opitutales bacterium]
MTVSPETILKAYRLTEKASLLQSNENKYTFEVAKDATATEIAAAVEKFYGVKVKNVNTVNVKGKVKLSRIKRGSVGVTGRMKKAIVTLAKGESIQLA